MAIELEKAYDASQVEDRIYREWRDAGYFNPDKLEGAPYSIVLPPPNVTGTLHIGHALMLVIEDILIRYKRMNGFKAVWIPGTDHAAIATQSKVEKLLDKEEGVRRHDLGRDEFLKRVEKYAQDSHDTIVDQIKAMGASVDWTREAYTLDETRSKAVRTAFKIMYDAGLIYRGHRVINWDPKGQTTISDDEIIHEERAAKLYTFKYSQDFPISISTTRPETKVGDTAVAVHPEDERYKEFVGKEYDAVFCGVPIHIKVIADESVEKEFGTGALGVTPAHSMIDYEIAQRHNLPLKQVINEYAKMTVDGDLNGKKTTEARGVIVDWLQAAGLLEKEENITQNVGTAERTGGVIEPLPKLQWFINVDQEFPMPHSELQGINKGDLVSLKKLMRHVVESGQIKITPNNYEKIYFNWIDNLRDWCISRQIWFGHRIPVWYRGEEIYCGVETPEGNGWEQDPDTLDTWFSSGLWTFTVMAHSPEQIRIENGRMVIDSQDFKTFHPTDVLETGYDILFFWVARMVLMTTYHIGQVPFKNVYLHGLVRDANKKKMSKSLGNVIDPLDMIKKYGTDAVRFALIFNTAPGTDIALAEDKIKGMKHFANKLWNIARFILANIPEEKLKDAINLPVQALTENDKSIIRNLDDKIKNTSTYIDQFRLHEAAQDLYQFTWTRFADEYIEQSKEQLKDEKLKDNTENILAKTLVITLKLLHPFMPFVTEEIWSKIDQKQPLIISSWPKTETST